MLGTRGVPASHGGFETAAEHVARYLVQRGWRVVVYCQTTGDGPLTETTWEGIEQVNIPVTDDGWLGTAEFDWLSIRHACRYDDINLTFGYNTGAFNIVQALTGIPNIINMDGIEWARERWGPLLRASFLANERAAAVLGDELIADHPVIAEYLRSVTPAEKVTTIAYGAPTVTQADPDIVARYGLTPGRYLTLIARPVAENSILEVVEGFSRRPRGVDLVILGDYKESDPFHRTVLAAAGPEVRFLGAVYEPEVTQALRFHSLAYVHGHTVGGTNPSLVEALGAANAVLAHDNPYNRWVAQDAGIFFRSADDVDAAVTRLVREEGLAARLSAAARARHAQEFTWDRVAAQYEDMLLTYVGRRPRRSMRLLGRSIVAALHKGAPPLVKS